MAGLGVMLRSLSRGSGNRNAIQRQYAREIHNLQTRLDTLQAGNRRLAEALVAARAARPAAPEQAPAARPVPERVTNSIGVELIKIPKGEFTMGSAPSESSRSGDECRVRVTLSRDFLSGKTEVTRG